MGNANYALRILKTFIVFAAGLFGLFVFLGNILDYGSNYQFVKHVLSMDTTFEGNELMWRAIETKFIYTVAYWVLILLEITFTVLALIGAYKMVLNLKGSARQFNSAKTYGFYAFLVGFGIWFVGFVIIGSEWFAMWQSGAWNGKQTAMDIVEVWGAFAILLALKDGELEETEK